MSNLPQTGLRGAAKPVTRVLLFLAAAAGLGAVAGVLWSLVVDLAAYTVGPNGGASTTERGLTEFFAGDAWFCLLGAGAGLLIGLTGWRLLKDLGWVLTLVVAIAALAAALVCWLVGYQLGPGNFTSRLADAKPGDVVPIDLTIRAKASLVVWPFLAMLPVLLGASLGRDEEEPRPILRGRGDGG